MRSTGGLPYERGARLGLHFRGVVRGRVEAANMLEYSFRYGLVPRKIEPEEVFHPSTLHT